MQTALDRIIVALDVPDTTSAIHLVDELTDAGIHWFKVGLELITPGYAPAVVKHVISKGGEIFWDGKIDDIPNTTAAAVRQAAGMGVSMITIHVSSGRASLEAAVANRGNMMILGLTALTSINDAESTRLFRRPSAQAVQDFAAFAAAAGAQAIICAPTDLSNMSTKLLKITPGIRPRWAAPNDQARIMTPNAAFAAGADYLVIGRPITRPPADIGTPAQAVRRIAAEIKEQL